MFIVTEYAALMPHLLLLQQQNTFCNRCTGWFRLNFVSCVYGNALFQHMFYVQFKIMLR